MAQTSDTQPTDRRFDSIDIDNGAPVAKAVALTLMLVALWSLLHLYKGLSGDAALYAVQALVRIRPGLATDIYLQNVSQDRFTIFSPLYSWCIGLVGLRNAALALTLAFTVWFMVAAWILARNLSNRVIAFLAVAGLIIIKCNYGSYGVFGVAENWLTARTLAEALVVTALACHFLGKNWLGLIIAASALFVHPIMALPGLLLLVCLCLPLRAAAIGAGLGILVALGMALAGSIDPKLSGLFAVMDTDWLEVVRERSQFLFVQYWTIDDWEVNSRPFLYLSISALSMDERVRKLSIAAMMVGATGLAIAAVASLIAPVAILLQGQAWRWVWITTFTSVLLLAPTVWRIWHDEKCGAICSVLLILGWTFSVMNSNTCVALALFLWLIRDCINEGTARYLRWAAAALGVVVVAWVLANSWTTAISPSPETGRDFFGITQVRDILGLGASAVLVVLLLLNCILATRSVVALSLISATLAILATFALRGSLQQMHRDGISAEFSEFADWREAIPPTATVYVVPPNSSATFAWFTLERPSYLSADQSAGVVFSRATALEVKRRSNVLLPLLDPDWRLLTKNTRAGHGQKAEIASARSLTRESLTHVCDDPILDFVVAKENLAAEGIRHTHAGNWKNWNLYDCRRVRSMLPIV